MNISKESSYLNTNPSTTDSDSGTELTEYSYININNKILLYDNGMTLNLNVIFKESSVHTRTNHKFINKGLRNVSIEDILTVVGIEMVISVLRLRRMSDYWSDKYFDSNFN